MENLDNQNQYTSSDVIFNVKKDYEDSFKTLLANHDILVRDEQIFKGKIAQPTTVRIKLNDRSTVSLQCAISKSEGAKIIHTIDKITLGIKLSDNIVVAAENVKELNEILNDETAKLNLQAYLETNPEPKSTESFFLPNGKTVTVTRQLQKTPH